MRSFPEGRLERLRQIGRLFQRTFIASYEHNVLGTAKGVAYSALLAFFPVLTSVTALLVQANATSVSRILSTLIFQVVPPGTEEIVYYNFTERGQRPLYLLILAGLLSLYAASGLMMTLMQGFRHAYGIRNGRSFWRERGMAAALVFAAAIPIVAASGLIVFGNRFERMVFTRIGVLPEGEQLKGWVSFIGQLARYGIALGAIAAGTALLYYLAPNRVQRLRYVWPGTFLAIGLWWVATTGFAFYVRNIANYNVLYGSIGAVVALLVWMYLLSVIALFGCEFNARLEIFRFRR